MAEATAIPRTEEEVKEGQVLAGSWTLGSALLRYCSASPTTGKQTPPWWVAITVELPTYLPQKKQWLNMATQKEKKLPSKVPQEATRERKRKAYALPTFLSIGIFL